MEWEKDNRSSQTRPGHIRSDQIKSSVQPLHDLELSRQIHSLSDMIYCDLHDPICVIGASEPCDLHTLAHTFWVGSLYRSRTTSLDGRHDRDDLDDLDRDVRDV